MPSDDAAWLRAGPDAAVRTWLGTLGVLPSVTLLQCGGHFPGSAVLHWADGADGRGVLLSGDTIFVTPGEDRVTFVWSAPNRLPLSEAAVAWRLGDSTAFIRSTGSTAGGGAARARLRHRGRDQPHRRARTSTKRPAPDRAHPRRPPSPAASTQSPVPSRPRAPPPQRGHDRVRGPEGGVPSAAREARRGARRSRARAAPGRARAAPGAPSPRRPGSRRAGRRPRALGGPRRRGARPGAAAALGSSSGSSGPSGLRDRWGRRDRWGPQGH